LKALIIAFHTQELFNLLFNIISSFYSPKDVLNIICCAKLVVKQGRKAMGLDLKIARLPNTIPLYDVLFCLISPCFEFQILFIQPYFVVPNLL